MNSPIYSYTSNPSAVSRMGTVHYSRNNGNYSSVPMMPMYAGPGQAIVSFGKNLKERWMGLDEEDKQFFKDQGQQFVQKKLGTGPTPQTTTTDPKQQFFPSRGKSQGIGAKVGAQVAPIRIMPTVPAGVRRPVVVEDTFLEKISKNRFNLVLASSALLLGAILINRRLKQ